MCARFPYSPYRYPPVPAVIVTIRSPDGTQAIPEVSAHLDTAADRTLVPLDLIRRLGLSPRPPLFARGLGSAPVQLDVYDIDIEITGVVIVSTSAITHANEPYVLVGRDLLNLFRVTFDGPNQVVEFH
jgi:hypothetical protein